jgi:catalase (peroxidase I)
VPFHPGRTDATQEQTDVDAFADRTTAQRASQVGIHTSQVTAWKMQLMAQVAELFADGRQAD